MSLRIGIDLDGTLADLSAIFHEYEQRLFGHQLPEEPDDADESAAESEPNRKEKLKASKQRSREHEAVWRAIRDTPDFWTLLKPIEHNAVRQLHDAAMRFKWEVFFITQRPRTASESVKYAESRRRQRQEQNVNGVLDQMRSAGRAQPGG